MIHRTSTRAGFSTVEATISMVIVGVMLVAALSTVGAAARSREARSHRAMGVALAEELMAEILTQRHEEPDATASAEQTLHSYTTGPSQVNVLQGQWFAQYFKPVLPPDATGWSVTRVEVLAGTFGGIGGVTDVRLCEANPDYTPSASIVDEVAVPESDLPSGAWYEIVFSDAKTIPPGRGLCLSLTTTSGTPTMQIDYDLASVVNPNAYFITGSSAGWDSVHADQAMNCRIYGTYSVGADPDALGPDAPELATSRADWDDIDDYDNWSGAPPVARDGSPIPDAAGWERDVKLFHVDPATLQNAGTRTGLKFIRVKTTAPSGEEFKATALRSDSGAQEQPLAFDTGFVTAIEIELQIAKDPPAEAAVTLVNHVLGTP